MHCADRNGDKGGNGRLVFFLDRSKADSLHYVWDTALVRELVGQRAIAPVADAMAKSITPGQRKEWAAGTPLGWANEAHRVAVEKLYIAVAEGGDPPKLGSQYVTKTTPVVVEQIKRAGVRLAMVLNQSLASADLPTSRPTPSVAATRPTTQPDGSLMRELARAVEIAQQKIRTTPSPAPSPPPRNSLQQSRTPAPPDPLKPIADELVGKSGSIAVQVVDVYDHKRQLVVGAPPAVGLTRGIVPYLVLAECENPTAPYLSPTQQAELRRARDFGQPEAGARIRQRAEDEKPKHRLWILTDDGAVQNWARGSRQFLHAKVISASLGRTPWYDYVKADVVVTMTPPPTATTAPSPLR